MQIRGEDLDWDCSDDETLAENKRKLDNDKPTTSKFEGSEPKWKKGSTLMMYQPISDEDLAVEKIVNLLHGKSPLEIYLLYLGDEVLNLIITFSEKYAKDNNRHDFELDRSQLLKFIGLLIFTGYHKLPQTQL